MSTVRAYRGMDSTNLVTIILDRTTAARLNYMLNDSDLTNATLAELAHQLDMLECYPWLDEEADFIQDDDKALWGSYGGTSSDDGI